MKVKLFLCCLLLAFYCIGEGKDFHFSCWVVMGNNISAADNVVKGINLLVCG